MEKFFIGDTHFGHKNIITFEDTASYRRFDSIDEHDEELIRRWNAKVKPGDQVYHLGDFAWTEKKVHIGERLNGDKVLIAGNHDTFATETYLRYFRKVCGALSFGHNFILTHIPVHTEQLRRWRWNIHGHLHNNRVMLSPHHPDTRYVCVSAEQIDLTPISFTELADKFMLQI